MIYIPCGSAVPFLEGSFVGPLEVGEDATLAALATNIVPNMLYNEDVANTLGPVCTGSQVLRPKSLEVNLCTLNH